jgi:EmrB/QacA subfamily drug resistance transporter
VNRTTNTLAVTIGVMLATFLAALDQTVVSTAMPTIVGSLGGLGVYTWVFSAYLLTSTTTVPVYGRLADMHGRKPIFTVGAILFLGGSALCGAANSMEQLIVFRAIQGLGAGAVLPISLTVVGDIYSVQRRAQIQGIFSAVWGLAAVLGPLAGGFIVDKISWRWIFYINIPFGVLSILLYFFFLHETVARRRHSIDYFGAAILTATVSVFLIGLLEIGQSGQLPVPWWVILVLAVALLAIFLWVERRVAEPLLPLTLFTNRVVAVSNSANFVIGMILIGLSSFIPPFVQGVMGGTAVNAGIVLMPMSISWPVGSTIGGRLILRYGYRPTVLAGTALIVVGILPLVTVDVATSQLFIMAAMAVLGLGMGFGATSFIVAVQSAVGWGERGIATASVQFFRTIGGAIGVAAMGAVLNAGIGQGLPAVERLHPGALGSGGVSGASIIMEPAARALLPADTMEAMRILLSSSLHTVYVAMAVVAVVGFLISLNFPRGSVEEHAHHSTREHPPASPDGMEQPSRATVEADAKGGSEG